MLLLGKLSNKLLQHFQNPLMPLYSYMNLPLFLRILYAKYKFCIVQCTVYSLVRIGFVISRESVFHFRTFESTTNDTNCLIENNLKIKI